MEAAAKAHEEEVLSRRRRWVTIPGSSCIAFTNTGVVLDAGQVFLADLGLFVQAG